MAFDNYLVDTDVLVDHLKNVSAAVKTLRKLSMKGKLFCSVINEAEILAGMREDERELVEVLFQALGVVDVTREIARLAGRYRRDYKKSHGVQITDAFIAATASLHNLILVTLNKKHFPMPEVKLEVPYAIKE